MKKIDDKGSYFCRSHVYLQLYDSWEVENIVFSYEYCIMKDNGEGKEFTPSLSVGEHKINAEESDVVNYHKVYFGLYPK